jgi:hypothetical protein
MSTYLHECPTCSAIIDPAQIPSGKASSFPCPTCGELLQVVEPHSLAIWIASILGSGALSYTFGLRGFLLLLTTLLGSPFLYLMAGFVMGVVGTPTKLQKVPPKQAFVRDGEFSLRLRDKPRR